MSNEQIQEVIIRPKPTSKVLVNPGKGFMTFQCFNGDNSKKRVNEGYPIEYQEFGGSLENLDHPATSLAYFRLYWRFIEPEPGQYRWDMIDKALETAVQRGQTLLLRIAPYGSREQDDVPAWYRSLVGEEKKLPVRWRTNPENPLYIKYFGGMIRGLGKRYDGHPALESVDTSIVGPWGEGAGSNLLTQETRKSLIGAYLETFPKTDLIMLLTDEKTNGYGLSQRNVGWRVDCLGDMGGFSKVWSHMLDFYPQQIIKSGMQDAWKNAPVSLEVCWNMQKWEDEGWDIEYIINESLKWHISSFNAKSSPVPKAWQNQVNEWIKRMGYRFVLRRFTYLPEVHPLGELNFTSWWENKGVAPIYKRYPLALRLKNEKHSEILVTGADITKWLPGDNIYDSSVLLPDMPEGKYNLQIAILDRDLTTFQIKVKLAIEGLQDDGWYQIGEIEVKS